jgi:hypothetical protein
MFAGNHSRFQSKKSNKKKQFHLFQGFKVTKTRKIEATPTLFEERIKTVENAVNSKDWFTAFTSIVTYYEYYAYWAIRNQCTSARAKLNKKAEDSLKRLGAANLALLLRIMDIIDNEEYSTIKRTIAESARAR